MGRKHREEIRKLGPGAGNPNTAPAGTSISLPPSILAAMLGQFPLRRRVPVSDFADVVVETPRDPPAE
ncbi:MAG: hypothetical protein IVW52_04985 [Acidimicrobiales bacterium]|nr:hypothetical protein [Acidimicrobiales bacterium]